MEKMSYRIGSLELRTCDDHLVVSGSNEHTTAEIVMWETCQVRGRPYCFTVAYFIKRSDDGFDLKTIGDRPIRLCNPVEFFKLAKAGFEHLEKELGEN